MQSGSRCANDLRDMPFYSLNILPQPARIQFIVLLSNILTILRQIRLVRA